jgi:peptide/nickel transport system permease protein
MIGWRKDRIDALAARADEGAGTSLAVDALRRLARSPVAITGAVIIALFIIVAVFADWIAPHGALDTFAVLKDELRPGHIEGAQPGFPLGSDDNGRDFLSRLIIASRQTLVVGVFATLIGLAAGLVIGIAAGAFGGWVDNVLMRFTDILLSIPSLLLAISIAALFAKASQATVIIAISVVTVPVFARLLRGSMLAQRSADHVLAARALGVKQGTIVFRHMLPNSLAPVIVQATLTLATAILDAAALSYLGLGDPDPRTAEWGLMLAGAQKYFEVRPELSFYPGVCIIIVALGFTLLGESMREALDPKNRR